MMRIRFPASRSQWQTRRNLPVVLNPRSKNLSHPMSVEVEETAGARVTYQVEAVNQFYFIKDAGAPLLDNLTSLGRFNQSFTLDVTLRPGAKATIENRSEKPKVLATFLLIDVYDAVNETAFSWPAEYGCLFYRAFPGAQDGMLAHWDYSEKAPKGVVAIDSGKASTAMIIADTWGTHKTRGTTDGVPVLDPRDPWTEVLRKKK